MTDSSPEALRKTTRLLVAAAVGMLCLSTALVAWLLWQSYHRYTEAAQDTARNTARSIEYFLNAHFQESELALDSAAQEYRRLREAGQFDKVRFSAYLHSLRQRLPNALSVRGADRDGNIVYGENVSSGKPVRIADKEHFQLVQRDLRLVFGPPLKSRITGDWQFSIMRPLIGPDGSFEGSVYVNTANQRIEDLFASIRLGNNSLIALFDEERRIIVRDPPLPRVENSDMRASAPATLEALRTGKTETTYMAVSTLDGQERMIAYRKIGHFPAYVVVGISKNTYLAPWWKECLLGIGFLIMLAVGSLLFALSLRRYMTASLRVEMLEERQVSHDHLAAIIRAIPDLLFEVDLEGRYLDYSTTNMELLAMPPDEYIGRKLSELLPAEAAATVMAAIAEANEQGSSYGAQIHIKVPSGELWYELSIARKQDHRTDKPTFIVLSRDITERSQAQMRIEQLAFSDMLTGLPNRRLFLDRLRQSMAVSERSQDCCALLFLDVDKFKTLNDTLGHHVGDILLVQIADRLRRSVRECDTVARLGGDEFVVLLEQLESDEGAAAKRARNVAEKIATQLSREYDLDGHKYLGTSSVGIALFTGQSVSCDELLRRADLAMYQAKSSGLSEVCFFDPQMQSNIAARLELELDLKQAIIHEEFVLRFQPQVDQNGRLIGAEALIRWDSPKRGMVSPAEFIDLAEETGLILPIGHWVMREACACLESWRQHPQLAHVAISVNVSARQIALPTFAEEVQELLSFYDIDADHLKLEITESMLVDRVDEIAAKISELRAIGVRFSLDDFGTGYSSLSYLKRLPFDQVKIDQAFARGALESHHDAAICRAIIALGQALSLDVVAEGIETKAQWDFFKAESCHYAQGYLFGRPMPREEFEARYADAPTNA